MTGEKTAQQEVPASQVCSAPLFLLNFDKITSETARQEPQFQPHALAPLQGTRSSFTLLQAAHVFGQHCCGEGGDGEGGKKILLDLQLISSSSEVLFLVS